MKIFKLEVLIIDEDVRDCEEAIDVIASTSYPNNTLVSVVTCKEAEVDWDDEHPLNRDDTQEQAMIDVFSILDPPCQTC